MSNREVEGVLREAGYEDLRSLIDYNDHVQDKLVWARDGPFISSEASDAIMARKRGSSKVEGAVALLEHVRKNFDLECLKKLSEALESDPTNRQNVQAGKLLSLAMEKMKERKEEEERRRLPQTQEQVFVSRAVNETECRALQSQSDGQSSHFDQKAFMEKFKDQFLQCVPAKTVATRWEIYDIIDENTCEEIQKAPPGDRSTLLYKYVSSHTDLDTASKMCDFMIDAGRSGYPRMKNLGEEMKKELRKYSK
jgi:hypothetical protein